MSASSLMAVFRYELLWNVRKRRVQAAFLIVFALSTLFLFLPPLLSGKVEANPNYAVAASASPAGPFGGLFLFIFGMVVFMNTISGEFESGTALTLLSKPISRRTIFLGKMLAALAVLLAAYTILTIYDLAAGWALYGPQQNLHLVPLGLLGTLISTLVYGSIILAIGSVTKSSTLAGFGGLGVWLAVAIAGSIIATLLGPVQALHYLPGGGAAGYLDVKDSPLGTEFAGPGPPTQFPGLPTSSGTDSLGGNLLRYALHGDAQVKFVKFQFSPQGEVSIEVMAVESMSQVLLRSLGVSLVYILAFTLLAFYAFKRAEVIESA